MKNPMQRFRLLQSSPWMQASSDGEWVRLKDVADAEIVAENARLLDENTKLRDEQAAVLDVLEEVRDEVSKSRVLIDRIDIVASEAARQLEAERAEAQSLRSWRVDVTSALQRPGGAHYADVPNHITTMRKTLRACFDDWWRARLSEREPGVVEPDFIAAARRILGDDVPHQGEEP